MNAETLARIFNLALAAIALGSTFAASADTLLIENVTLIDGTGRAPVAGASVLIDEERIRLAVEAVFSPAV